MIIALILSFYFVILYYKFRVYSVVFRGLLASFYFFNFLKRQHFKILLPIIESTKPITKIKTGSRLMIFASINLLSRCSSCKMHCKSKTSFLTKSSDSLISKIVSRVFDQSLGMTPIIPITCMKFT